MEDFTGFRLRRGGALSMTLAGVHGRVIREVGRWKSYADRVCIDLTEQEKVDAQLKASCVRSGSTCAELVQRCGQYQPDRPRQ